MKGVLLLLAAAVTVVLAPRLVASKPVHAAAKEETIEYIQFINQQLPADTAVKREVHYSGDQEYYTHSKLTSGGPAQVPGSGIDESNTTSDEGDLHENPNEGDLQEKPEEE